MKVADSPDGLGADVIERHCRAMIRDGCQPASATARRYVLGSWALWIGRRWRESTWRDVEQWTDAMAPGCGPSRRRDKVSHLHRFYLWAQREGLADSDPTVLVARARSPVALPRPVSEGALAVAFAAAGGDPEMTAVLALMGVAGMRCTEVAELAWSDVDLGAGLAYVLGKGAKRQMVGLPDDAVRALAGLDGVTGPVVAWSSSRRRDVRASAVSRRVNRFLRSAGIAATAHQLRHRFACQILARGGQMTDVQQGLRHVSVATTEVYARVDPERARAAVARVRRPD